MSTPRALGAALLVSALCIPVAARGQSSSPASGKKKFGLIELQPLGVMALPVPGYGAGACWYASAKVCLGAEYERGTLKFPAMKLNGHIEMDEYKALARITFQDPFYVQLSVSLRNRTEDVELEDPETETYVPAVSKMKMYGFGGGVGVTKSAGPVHASFEAVGLFVPLVAEGISVSYKGKPGTDAIEKEKKDLARIGKKQTYSLLRLKLGVSL